MMGKIGVTELLLILGIVVLLFGTRKLRNMGGDLGSALSSFRKAMSESDAAPATSEALPADAEQKPGGIIEGEVSPEKSGTKA